VVLAVVAAHPALAKGLGQTLDLVPAELQAGGHHQHVVAEALAAGRAHQVAIRIETSHRIADPGHPRWDEIGFSAASLLKAEHTCTHQGPARLVVVIARGLENRHRKGRTGPFQLGCGGDAGGAAADNQNLVMGHKKGRWWSSGWMPFLPL
jgi:hypothetical protein